MHVYEAVLWLVALILTLLGGWIIILNFSIWYRWFARGEHHSWIPFVGGFLAMLGMMACPLTSVRKLAWLPLAVDAGYVLTNYVYALVALIWRTLRRRHADPSAPKQ